MMNLNHLKKLNQILKDRELLLQIEDKNFHLSLIVEISKIVIKILWSKIIFKYKLVRNLKLLINLYSELIMITKHFISNLKTIKNLLIQNKIKFTKLSMIGEHFKRI